jgi:type II secretory pathway component GspD/PulD (secretin)
MKKIYNKKSYKNLMFYIMFCIISASSTNLYAENTKKISLALHDVEISEAMEMLSIKEHVNIVLSRGVEGTISVNLYDVSLRQAILSIADAAGYAVEFRNGSYFIIKREESGKYAQSGLTELRAFKVEYSDTNLVEQILETYLSEYGKITNLAQRRMLVVEDLPSFINRIEKILAEIDQQPKQIFIEAKILEISLRDSESFGLDWSRLFNIDGGTGAIGTRGLSNPISPGLFFDLVTPNVDIALDTLFTRGRLRTLSTPKLLALEDQEAEVVIGDRLGFRVTTTINQITSETIEFLESGVILRVLPSVDGQGRIMLTIHPEVSTGRVEDGIPNQVTTEVTTQMLVEDGQTVFIGGLIRRSLDQNREGVPILGDLPLVGRVFSNKFDSSLNTETVVMITPHIVDDHNNSINAVEKARAIQIENQLEHRSSEIDSKIDKSFSKENINVEKENVSFNKENYDKGISNPALSSNCSPQHPANLSAYGC